MVSFSSIANSTLICCNTKRSLIAFGCILDKPENSKNWYWFECFMWCFGDAFLILRSAQRSSNFNLFEQYYTTE